MKPYYKENGITIYHGDCRDILPTLPKVDLVLTDPPYGMNFQSNHRAIKHLKIIGDEALDVILIRNIISFAERASYIFCRWDNLKDMPPPKERFMLGQK